MMEPALSEFRSAVARTQPFVRRTPLLRSDWLSARTGREVFLKLESLQVTGSFKARGAVNAVRSIVERWPRDAEPPRIVTASAGNHGRALAWAARSVGVRVVVFTPQSAPAAKVEAIRGHGAELRAEAGSYEEAERLAKAFAAETGAVFLSAYSHADLIAATGSIALEILDDLARTACIVVPVGGGGLVAGIAAAARLAKPGIEIVGVEAEASRPFAASLAAGRIVEVEVGPTIADGLAGNMDADNLAFPIVQARVNRMVAVSEDAMRDGIRGLVKHERLVAEGAGIVGVAAVASGVVAPRDPTVVVVSGANIDADRLAAILSPAGATGRAGV